MVWGWPHGSGRKVATQALFIVGRRIAHEFLVRVMASHASQASVPLPSPATALFQAIRLSAQVGKPLETAKLDVPPGAMTGTTEINGIDWVELAGIED